MKNIIYMILVVTALMALPSTKAFAIDFLFEDELPIKYQQNLDKSIVFTKCEVKSFIYEGNLRYYQTYLKAPPDTRVFIASANTNRDPSFNGTNFSYEDATVMVVGTKVVKVKAMTEYVLDPQTLKVLRSELRGTDEAGNLIYRFVCEAGNISS